MVNLSSPLQKKDVILILLFVPILFFCQCHSQGQTTDQEHSLNISPLSETEFQKYIRTTQEKYDIPGIAAVVVRSTGIVQKGVAGKRRLGFGQGITINDRFHIGSNTKAMTGFLAGLLVEKKLLEWNTKVLEVFPQFRDTAKDAYASVTLRDVLSHRAGILPFKSPAEFIPLPEFAGSAREKRKSFTEWLLQQNPVPLESTGYAYSNAGYCVAASMLEEVAETSWEALMLEELFKPLGINGQFQWPAKQNNRQPWGHWIQDGQLVPHDPNDDYQLPEIIRPAGDISMSVLDYAKWLETLLKGIGGEDTIITSSTCRFLLYGNMEFSSYSIGWGSLKSEGLTISAHDGSAGTFYCHALVAKELDLAIALLANAATQRVSEGLRSLSQTILKKYKSHRQKDKE